MKIVTWPHPALSTVASSLVRSDGETDALSGLKVGNLAKLGANMIQLMLAADGIGLAANQVGMPVRMIAIIIGGHPRVLVNPAIVASSHDVQTQREGCLSFPGIFENVTRHTTVIVAAVDTDLKPIENLHLTGLEASCFLHELDHLNGIVFTSKLSQLKRSRIDKKMHKYQDAVGSKYLHIHDENCHH